MSGIAGFFAQKNQLIEKGGKSLAAMNFLQKHRGAVADTFLAPEGYWGFASVRSAECADNLIWRDGAGNAVCFSGCLHNAPELREELADFFTFRSHSDAEVVLACYLKWGMQCAHHLRGPFAFALFDAESGKLVCFRDRLGIGHFYYIWVDNKFYFASEIKALVPFLKEVKIDDNALTQYLTFQYCLDDSTLFAGVKKLMPASCIVCPQNGDAKIEKYWDLQYNLDFDHSEKYFIEAVREKIEDAVNVSLRGKKELGGCLSGGLDSSIITTLASRQCSGEFMAFTGKFTCFPGYDESNYAKLVAERNNMKFCDVDISAKDFAENISKVIYHLDEPAAGVGSFSQYCVAKYASQFRSITLGGQGGDEIFGGYARYLVAYFEQCIKGAIEGTLHDGDFVVSYESIIPNLRTLENYKPMIRSFWKDGVFDSLDSRYFRLVNRAPELGKEIRLEAIKSTCDIRELFNGIFNRKNAQPASYIDKMMHYDFNTSLPALLQVEDRMSMAFGMESVCPFLDHKLIEFLATIPGSFKFKNGELKRLLKLACGDLLPDEILNRKDKMGFPTPLSEWMKSDLKDFVGDIFVTQKNRQREYFDSDLILNSLGGEGKFSRKIWGLLSLELWFQNYVDKAQEFRDLVK